MPELKAPLQSHSCNVECRFGDRHRLDYMLEDTVRWFIAAQPKRPSRLHLQPHYQRTQRSPATKSQPPGHLTCGGRTCAHVQAAVECTPWPLFFSFFFFLSLFDFAHRQPKQQNGQLWTIGSTAYGYRITYNIKSYAAAVRLTAAARPMRSLETRDGGAGRLFSRERGECSGGRAQSTSGLSARACPYFCPPQLAKLGRNAGGQVASSYPVRPVRVASHSREGRHPERLITFVPWTIQKGRSVSCMTLRPLHPSSHNICNRRHGSPDLIGRPL